MSSAVHLAGPEDIDRVLSLMARFHDETGKTYDDQHRAAIAAPLVEGSPLGAVWLIGPQRAPLGYVMVTFGWSVPHGGMIGWLSEVYIRASVRNRGIGTEVVHAVSKSLGDAGVMALHAVEPDDNAAAARFCARAGFGAGETQTVLTERLA